MGLERTIYSVSESVGAVDVCTTLFQLASSSVDCPIAFPFTINFFTTDDSAGIYVFDSAGSYTCSYHV